MVAQVCVSLYDAQCNLLFTSWKAPASCRFELGKPMWNRLAAEDRTPVQAAFLRCLTVDSVERFDAGWGIAGRWRTWLWPCCVASIRAVAYSERAPTELQLLTPRELEVLRLVASCFTPPMIARKLDISRSTVDVLRARIAKKVEVPTLMLSAWAGTVARFL